MTWFDHLDPSQVCVYFCILMYDSMTSLLETYSFSSQETLADNTHLQ